MSTLVLLANLAATLFMTGVIWFVQIVHYPLFSAVGTVEFARYELSHTRLVTWVVAPPMLLELGTALLLLAAPPRGVSVPALWAGVALVLVLWASTVLLQIPQHNALVSGFAADAHRRLVIGNWLRTFAWSARSALLLWLTAQALRTA
jgi:uncharacterized membrane protein